MLDTKHFMELVTIPANVSSSLIPMGLQLPINITIADPTACVIGYPGPSNRSCYDRMLTPSASERLQVGASLEPDSEGFSILTFAPYSPNLTVN